MNELVEVTLEEAELLKGFRSCDDDARSHIMIKVKVGVEFSAERASRPLAVVASIFSAREQKALEN